MPVRSLSSPVLRWPEPAVVLQAARAWAEGIRARQSGVVRVGVFGSYARGDAGVGSDLDLVVVVQADDEPFTRRAARWDVTRLPVPAEVLVYTEAEWNALHERGGRFAETLLREVVWV